MMNTLNVTEKVERSIIGTCMASPRMPEIEIGKAVPCIKSSEDAEALMACDFLDPTAPCEINLLDGPYTRKIIQRRFLSTGDPSIKALISERSAIGFLPSECLYKPTKSACEALKKTGSIGEQVSKLRSNNSEKRFWVELTKNQLYEPWLKELLLEMSKLKVDLLAPPVPVICKEVPTSVEMQLKANIDVAFSWNRICGRKHREMGMVYSLHVAQNAFDEPKLIRKILPGLREILGSEDMRFWAIHISFTDVKQVTSKPSRVEVAKELIREVVKIASMYNGFVFVSDVGPIGPALLDEGVSFVSYSSAMTPRKRYLDGFNSKNADSDILYGKIIDLWRYNLIDYNTLEKMDFKVSDTGLMSNTVPVQLRGSKKKFRVEWGKKNNIAVMEKINRLRHDELSLKNPKPGSAHISKSKDVNIIPWA